SVDTKEFELDPEKQDTLACVLVEPSQSLAVLLAHMRRNPHQNFRVESSGVRQQLAEVRVIRLLELVLDEDRCLRTKIDSDEICRKESDADFLVDLRIDLYSECGTEK